MARHVRRLASISPQSPHPQPRHTSFLPCRKKDVYNGSRALTFCDTGTLGISEYAAKALGDVVYIELPQVDMEVAEGDVIGAVESVKSASDILTPIAGVVSEVNEALETTPGNVNKDPEGDAWVAKITVSAEPKGKTMSKEEYAAFTEE